MARIYAFAGVVAGLAMAASPAIPPGDWPVYGRDPGGSKSSPLKQINRGNVARLAVAWTFHTKQMYTPPEHQGGKRSAFESTPLFVDGVLYVTTASGRIIALNPATGVEKWTFDPKSELDVGWGDFANRGVASWVDPKTRKRFLYIATIDARLVCVDAEDGHACPAFGERGFVNLALGLRNPPNAKWEYEETSPPAIVNGLVVVGSAVADNQWAHAASGEVRAFDARTGRLRWTWDPMPGQLAGAANAWSIISVDPARNLVFVPTGSASPDYYGGERPGADLFANCVVALRGDTGREVWHFQTVHHDLWDYDVASQPALLDIRKGGKSIPVVAVGSKTGNLFILDRVTGEPIFGVEERPVPKSDVPGETASPTQPFPILPEPLSSQAPVTAPDAFGLTEADRKFCADRIQANRSEGIFTPPSLRGSLVRPGNIGGLHWGGVAFDSASNLLIAPTNEFVAEVRLIPRDQFDAVVGHEPGWEYARQRGSPFGMMRQFLVSPSGLPCTKPPFGNLTAIDMDTGRVRWKVPLGAYSPDPSNAKIPKSSSPALGGPIVTAGGVVFMGGTLDSHLCAYDLASGAVLWRGDLPAAARATPMTYQVNGKQYVVIAAGGFDWPGQVQSDALVAFALP